jgi:DNA-binding transcriptional MerR regulator
MQIMQTREVTKKLGINRERIKYFKKQGVFIPEKTIPDSKNAEYTERDVAALRKLVVLTKSGLTCRDIKKVQDGEWTLQEAIIERRRLVEEEMKRMSGSLLLSQELLENDVQYDSIPTDYFWNGIQQKEQEGEAFMHVNDVYDYRPVPLMRIVKCPLCSADQEVDLEDYLWDETSNENSFDNDMGPDIMYSFDTEDNCECEKCGEVFRVEGWIREYPIGAYDSEHIEVHLMEDFHEEN